MFKYIDARNRVDKWRKTTSMLIQYLILCTFWEDVIYTVGSGAQYVFHKGVENTSQI